MENSGFIIYIQTLLTVSSGAGVSSGVGVSSSAGVASVSLASDEEVLLNLCCFASFPSLSICISSSNIFITFSLAQRSKYICPAGILVISFSYLLYSG